MRLRVIAKSKNIDDTILRTYIFKLVYFRMFLATRGGISLGQAFCCYR